MRLLSPTRVVADFNGDPLDRGGMPRRAHQQKNWLTQWPHHVERRLRQKEAIERAAFRRIGFSEGIHQA
jgi:hypothetical protein